jgi:hypothetical protein
MNDEALEGIPWSNTAEAELALLLPDWECKHGWFEHEGCSEGCYEPVEQS